MTESLQTWEFHQDMDIFRKHRNSTKFGRRFLRSKNLNRKNDFSNFLNLRILLEEGYLSKIPNSIKFDQKIFRVEESDMQHDFFTLKFFGQTL
jgi:hypothetical protein